MREGRRLPSAGAPEKILLSKKRIANFFVGFQRLSAQNPVGEMVFTAWNPRGTRFQGPILSVTLITVGIVVTVQPSLRSGMHFREPAIL